MSTRLRHHLLLLATLLAATALPLRYFERSLWRDEATSIWFARLPLSTLLTSLCDPHPPGYYLLLRAWTAAGEQEFWLRLPSLWAVVLAAALVYRLGQASCGPHCGRLAAMLLALHPLQSWYAAEVRMYALVQGLGLLMVWLGWRLLQQRASSTVYRRSAIAYGGTALSSFGVDYAAILPFGLLQILWLAKGRPAPRCWLKLQTVILVLAGLLWVTGSRLNALHYNYLPVLVAVRANQLGLEIDPTGAARLLGLTFLALLLGGLWLAWSYFQCPVQHLSKWLYWAAAGGWLLLLLFTALPGALTIKRQLVVLLPYLALLTAYMLARRPKPVGQLIASLGMLITLLILPFHPRESWRKAVTHLLQDSSTQSAVVWVDELAVPAFSYYVRQNQPVVDPVEWTPLLGGQLPPLTPQSGQPLWLVSIQSPYRNITALLPPNFYRQYRLVQARHLPGIGLYQYQRQGDMSAKSDFKTPIHKWGLFLPSPLDTCR